MFIKSCLLSVRALREQRLWFRWTLPTSRTLLFIMVCVSLMDGLTENEAWRKPRTDAHFRLKESQPFRGMMSILVLNLRILRGLHFPFMQLKFKRVRRLFQIQLVLEGIFSFFLIKWASHVIKSLYQGQQPGCLFFEANFVISFICQHSLFTVFYFLHSSNRQNCVPS